MARDMSWKIKRCVSYLYPKLMKLIISVINNFPEDNEMKDD